ncbi:UNVERIFIED_CONTAM: hypothetical protein PYX00_009039 [Menopon gallinae]|uniref:CN hydrolase domain-containing protein n=1 Tax=Menopon gallinae TaxID=328185 RepID=A0AAW2HAE4_9NEOP
MEKWTALLLACLLQVGAQAGPVNPTSYVAFVNEYRSRGSTYANIADYNIIIQSVTGNPFQGDLIVFPEGTLTGNDTSVPVPNPEDKIVPYKDEFYKKFAPLEAISRSAATFKAYVVVNLNERLECEEGDICPPRGYFKYNTNVVFDREGTVIARYRKFNVCQGFDVDRPETAELSTFTTDFGVTFGLFTGFDIFFKAPALDLIREKNIRNVVYPSRWRAELPFLTSVQVQSGFSYALDINLLAAGVNDIDNGSTGTGIYLGRSGRANFNSDLEGSLLIYKRLPGGDNAEKTSFAISTDTDMALDRLKYSEDPTIASASGKDLDMKAESFEEEICYGDRCCRFSAKYRPSGLGNAEKYSYRAVVFEGERSVGPNTRMNAAYCAIVLCTDGNCARRPPNGKFPLIFDEINIEGNFPTENTFQMPSTLAYQNCDSISFFNVMEYDRFSFERVEDSESGTSKASISLKKPGAGDLMTFGIFGRF